MDIRELAYTIYKINWMRHISAEQMSDIVKDYFDECQSLRDEGIMPDQTLDEYIEERGFSGQIYVCFDEFMQSEYKDREYIQSLLSESQFKQYLDDIDTIDSHTNDCSAAFIIKNQSSDRMSTQEYYTLLSKLKPASCIKHEIIRSDDGKIIAIGLVSGEIENFMDDKEDMRNRIKACIEGINDIKSYKPYKHKCGYCKIWF